jgi:hypothetical protein
MAMKPTLSISAELTERSRQWALKFIKAAKSPPTAAHARSRSLSYRGAEGNVSLLWSAKMAECALCLYLDLDPERDLQWSAPDSGTDLTYRGVRIDVKHSAHKEPRFCLWPLKKNHLFDKKQFDVIVLVSGGPTFAIEGWMGKEEFRGSCLIAGEDHPLDEGTRYVEVGELAHIESLAKDARESVRGKRLRQYAEKCEQAAIPREIIDTTVWLMAFQPGELAQWIEKNPNLPSIRISDWTARP